MSICEQSKRTIDTQKNAQKVLIVFSLIPHTGEVRPVLAGWPQARPLRRYPGHHDADRRRERLEHQGFRRPDGRQTMSKNENISSYIAHNTSKLIPQPLCSISALRALDNFPPAWYSFTTPGSGETIVDKMPCLGAYAPSGVRTHDPLITSREHKPIHTPQPQ